MRAIIVGIVLAGMALAETVYFGTASKAFHKTVACSARPGKPHQLHADRAIAEKHGLSECKRCWRAGKAAAGSGKAGGNGAWAEKSEAKEVK